MKKGDKVYLTFKEEVTGIVMDVDIDSMLGLQVNRYLIKYDDTDLVPPQDWHEELELELTYQLPSKKVKAITCECGVSKVMRNGKHSSYCPLYNR